MVVGFEPPGFAVPDDGHGVVASAGQPPDQRAVAVGDVDDSEAGGGVLQNAPLHDAERTPGKLNELDHAARGGWAAPTRSGRLSVNCFSRLNDFCTTASKWRGEYWSPAVCNLRRALSTALCSRVNSAASFLAAWSIASNRSNSRIRGARPARICSRSCRTRAISSRLNV